MSSLGFVGSPKNKRARSVLSDGVGFDSPVKAASCTARFLHCPTTISTKPSATEAVATHLPNGAVTVKFLQSTDGDRAASVQSITTGNAEMAEGTIKKLTTRASGSSTQGRAKDLFFHSSSVQGVSFEELHEGQKVSYTEGQSPKGPCAENVKPV